MPPVASFLCALVVPLLPAVAGAQALDLIVDASVGTGVRRAVGDGEAISQRAPTYLDVDVGFVFDHDFTSEWGLGMTLQLEDQAAFALTPQVRLVRGRIPWHFFLGAGVPVYVMPDTLLGLEFGTGLVFDVLDGVGLVGQGAVDWFFAGGDLPKDESLLVFNVSAGVRVLF